MDSLFQDISISDLAVKNRVVMPPMSSHFADGDGNATDQTVAYYRERARGGTGLVIFEATYATEPLGDRHLITRDDHVPALRRVTDAVHEAGGKIALQINPSRGSVDGHDPVAPSETTVPEDSSPVSLPGEHGNEEEVGKTARRITREEIADITEKFGEGVGRASEAGFDAVEIHGAHGYLLHQFFSPRTNRREDEYGGSVADRTRFAKELLAAGRKAAGSDFPMWVRISGSDFLEGGVDADVSRAVAEELAAAGSDAIHVSGGHTWNQGSGAYGYLTPTDERAMFAPLAANVREAVDVPVIAAGRINDVEVAAGVLDRGDADLVAMGRAHIADPHFVHKAREGKLEHIRHCVGGLEGCREIAMSGSGIRCTVNPMAGLEHRLSVEPAETTCHVLVVGGGPAGMEVARVASERGHKVTLCERESELGGQLRWAKNTASKWEYETLIEFYKAELDRENVTVRLGEEMTEADIESFGADEVVVATGSTARIPTIQGLGDATVDGRVCTDEEFLTGEAGEADSYAIIGGSESASDIALTLAAEGTESTVVVESDEDFLPLHGPLTHEYFTNRLQDDHITVETDASVRAIDDEGVVFRDDSGTERHVEAGQIILAKPRAADPTLHDLDVDVSVYRVGDTTDTVGLYAAVHDGAELARSL